MRLEKNERLIPFPDCVLARYRELLTPEAIMAYPELEPLYERLSCYLGVDRGEIFFAAGSDLGIKAIFETYVAPGDRIVIHSPSYAMLHVYARIFQSNTVCVPYHTDLSLDVHAFLAAIQPGTRLVVLENPNGSIGTALPENSMKDLLEKTRQCGSLLLVDEAYYAFSQLTVQPYFREYDHLIISRTFSKDLGLAGLRCAYLLSQKANIRSIFHVKPMHEISSPAVAFACASLEFPETIQAYVNEVRQGIAELRKAFEGHGFRTAGGQGNFLLIYVGDDADFPTFTTAMKAQGILIRPPSSSPALQGWIRVGVGTAVQRQHLLESFVSSLQKARKGKRS
jgi:histidinol-phosphate aminotransferase